MDAWQAAVLGLVEGLTEYLPVSSTGHLLLAERALGMPASANANAFAICIQSGAILAVFALYRARMAQVVRGLTGRDAEGLRLFRNLAVAFFPAAVVGVLLGNTIERHLFGLWPIVAAWAAGGVFLFWLARARPGEAGLALGELSLRAAAIVGLCQCVAMWPGISRSLATIAGGLLCGLGLAAAIEFSFLLGLVTLLGATAYKAAQHGAGLAEEVGGLAIAIGVGVAFVSAWASVKWMVSAFNARTLAVFGAYRLLLAAAVAGLLLSGVLESG